MHAPIERQMSAFLNNELYLQSHEQTNKQNTYDHQENADAMLCAMYNLLKFVF